MAIDEIGIGLGRDIGDVGHAHAHPRPHGALGDGLIEALLARIAEEIDQGAALAIIDIRDLFEPVEDGVGTLEGPVAEHQHVFAVIGDRVGAGRIDDDRAVMAHLFLQAGMGVIPIRARLDHREAVLESLARRDPGIGQAGHAIHLEGKKNAVPVNGGILVQPVGDVERDVIALAPAQHGRRQMTVHGHRPAAAAINGDRCAADIEVEARARQGRQAGAAQWRCALGPGRQQR